MMGGNTILKTTDLSIGYSSKKETTIIASGINLCLENKKLITLIGENGIGKSTFLKTITGIKKPLSGKVFLSDFDLHSLTDLERSKKLSVVLTESLPDNNLTVFELVALGRQPYTNWVGKLVQKDLQKIDEVMCLTQINHLASKKSYEISDGQLQIVLIARALAQDTPLIILDEPATHLDLVHKVNLFRLLKKLTLETEKCILFSTHDIDMAIQISDEMIIMSRESIVQNQPCNLILNGDFDKLFTHDHLRFDAKNGKFIIKE